MQKKKTAIITARMTPADKKAITQRAKAAGMTVTDYLTICALGKEIVRVEEHIRFHDLRHTFATLALQNGVDIKTVSSMLGHYDAGFTLRTYTHATRQMQDQAAETMGNFMAQVM